MINSNKTKESAINILKNILFFLHNKDFKSIMSIISDSEIDDLEEYLNEYFIGTLEENGYTTIDEYGVKCSFNPPYQYSQLDIYDYNDGSGFLLEYAMTSNGDLVDMSLQLEFLYTENKDTKCIFKGIDF